MSSSRVKFIIIIIIIIIMLWFLLLLLLSILSQSLSFWHFSWTNDDPHRPGFKFQTTALSVLCVMFQV